MDAQIAYIQKLPQSIKESIVWYTGADYEEFNTSLRKGKIPKERQHYENLLTAFSGVPPLKTPLTVFRGKKSDTMRDTDRAFVSTSMVLEGTEDFRGKSCCIMQITVSPGSKVLPIFDISGIKSENEVLLDRDGNFRVTGSDIWDYRDSFGTQVSMKMFFVTYSPRNSVPIKTLSDYKEAEPKLDKDLIKERIITYLKRKGDLEDIEEEITLLSNRMHVELSKEDVEAIKIRLR